MPRFENRAVPIVLAAVCIDAIGFGIVSPILPTLITRLGQLGLEDATRMAGWLLAAFSTAQFFAGPVLGTLGDHFGRRPVLIAAMLGFSLDHLLVALAPNLAWLFVGRVIAGVCGATYGNAGAVIQFGVPSLSPLDEPPRLRRSGVRGRESPEALPPRGLSPARGCRSARGPRS